MAADNEPTDLLPLLSDDEPHFDVGMRGYDKRQVDAYVARAESEIAELQASRDGALAISADRAAQLASRDAHVETMKRQLAKASDLNPANVSDRIRDMLQLANEEAAQTRKKAEQDADRTLAEARADAEKLRGEAAAEQQRLLAAAKQRSTEAEKMLAHARTESAELLASARATIATETAAAEAERTRLDESAAQARTDADVAAAEHRAIADEDFEITLRKRRTQTEQEHRAADEESVQRANQLISEARAQAERTIAQATARTEQLAAERAQTRKALDDLHGRIGRVLHDTAES